MSRTLLPPLSFGGQTDNTHHHMAHSPANNLDVAAAAASTTGHQGRFRVNNFVYGNNSSLLNQSPSYSAIHGVTQASDGGLANLNSTGQFYMDVDSSKQAQGIAEHEGSPHMGGMMGKLVQQTGHKARVSAPSPSLAEQQLRQRRVSATPLSQDNSPRTHYQQHPQAQHPQQAYQATQQQHHGYTHYQASPRHQAQQHFPAHHQQATAATATQHLSTLHQQQQQAAAHTATTTQHHQTTQEQEQQRHYQQQQLQQQRQAQQQAEQRQQQAEQQRQQEEQRRLAEEQRRQQEEQRRQQRRQAEQQRQQAEQQQREQQQRQQAEQQRLQAEREQQAAQQAAQQAQQQQTQHQTPQQTQPDATIDPSSLLSEYSRILEYFRTGSADVIVQRLAEHVRKSMDIGPGTLLTRMCEVFPASYTAQQPQAQANEAEVAGGDKEAAEGGALGDTPRKRGRPKGAKNKIKSGDSKHRESASLKKCLRCNEMVPSDAKSGCQVPHPYKSFSEGLVVSENPRRKNNYKTTWKWKCCGKEVTSTSAQIEQWPRAGDDSSGGVCYTGEHQLEDDDTNAGPPKKKHKKKHNRTSSGVGDSSGQQNAAEPSSSYPDASQGYQSQQAQTNDQGASSSAPGAGGDNNDPDSKKKRGRPKGAKSKPKPPKEENAEGSNDQPKKKKKKKNKDKAAKAEQQSGQGQDQTSSSQVDHQQTQQTPQQPQQQNQAASQHHPDDLFSGWPTFSDADSAFGGNATLHNVGDTSSSGLNGVNINPSLLSDTNSLLGDTYGSAASQSPASRKRGRPKGSPNKNPKATPVTASQQAQQPQQTPQPSSQQPQQPQDSTQQQAQHQQQSQHRHSQSLTQHHQPSHLQKPHDVASAHSPRTIDQGLGIRNSQQQHQSHYQHQQHQQHANPMVADVPMHINFNQDDWRL